MRKRLNFEFDDQIHLTVRVASTREELEAAFALHYKVYLEEGYTQTNEHGLRISNFDALPTTTTVVALVDGKVVGTLKSVRDSAMGLPSDPIADFSASRAKYPRISEISGLAIDPDYRGHNGRVLFPLIKYIHMYERHYHGVDAFVIAVNPKHAPFWEKVVLFESICEEVKPSSVAEGAPAVIKIQDLHTHLDRAKAAYANAPARSDFHAYMTRHEPDFEFPLRIYPQAFDTLMSPENFKYFFKERSQVLQNLSSSEMIKVRSNYVMPEYTAVLGGQAPLRQSQRFAFHAKGRWMGEAACIVPVQIAEVSSNGIGLIMDDSPIGTTQTLSVSIGPSTFRLRVIPVWRSNRNYVGCRIIDAPAEWDQMIQHLTQQMLGAAAHQEQVRQNRGA